MSDVDPSATLLERLRADWQLEPLEPVDEGMGESLVFRTGAHFLKFGDDDVSAVALRDEIARTQWLAAQGVPVPKTVRVHDDGNNVAWLTTALPGTDALQSTLPPAQLVASIGEALRTLHALPAATCPFDESIPARLAIARRDIDAGIVDPDQFDDRNEGVSAEEIYQRLAQSPPPEELVVIHGDASLNNIIVAPDGSVGFVDCGRAGRADRYVDLSIAANYIAECFGPEWVAPFAVAYGEADWQSDKALYFLDLYELF